MAITRGFTQHLPQALDSVSIVKTGAIAVVDTLFGFEYGEKMQWVTDPSGTEAS